jgi:hypothetical protein
VRPARAKGLTQRVIVMKHGLRNAIIPVFGFNMLGDALREVLDLSTWRCEVSAVAARAEPLKSERQYEVSAA